MVVDNRLDRYQRNLFADVLFWVWHKWWCKHDNKFKNNICNYDFTTLLVRSIFRSKTIIYTCTKYSVASDLIYLLVSQYASPCKFPQWIQSRRVTESHPAQFRLRPDPTRQVVYYKWRECTRPACAIKRSTRNMWPLNDSPSLACSLSPSRRFCAVAHPRRAQHRQHSAGAFL